MHLPYPPTPYIVKSTSPILNVPSLLFFFIRILPMRHTPSPSLIFFELFSVARLLTAKNSLEKQGNSGVWKMHGSENGSDGFVIGVYNSEGLIMLGSSSYITAS